MPALALALLAGSAEASTVSYREGDGKGFVSRTDDAWLRQASPDTNDSVSNKCVVDGDLDQHCVLKFPSIFGDGINQIPVGSHVVNATLTLFVTNAGTDCPIVYQLTEGWTVAEVTWNSRATAVSWTSPGAEGVGSHKPVAEGVLPCAAPLGAKAVDVTGSVQSWSDGEANEGWVIVDGNTSDGVDISSSAEPVLGERPMLTVTFVPPVFYSVGTDTGDLKTGSPTITVSGDTATLSAAQSRDIGVGDEIDYGPLAYITSVIGPTQFLVQSADGSAPAPASGVLVSAIKRAFNSIDAAVAGSSDAQHLGTTDLAGTFGKLQWVLYDDGPFDLFSTASITGYTTAPDHNITLTVAGASQVASGNSQRHAGLEGTGVRLEMQASAQFALDVDVPYTRIEWLEVDGNDIPMVGGVLVKPNGHEVLLRNLIVHNTRGDSLAGSAVNVTAGADDVQIHNLVAYDFGGDGVFMSGSFGKVANSTFYLGRSSGSSSVRTDTGGDSSGYNVLAVGPGTAFREDTLGSLTLHNCVSTDSSACDLDVSGFCRTNVPPVTEFVSPGSPVNLHLKPGAAARDFGFDLTGIFSDDIDGQNRPIGLAWDVGADEAPLLSGTTHYRSIGTATDLVDEGSITVTAGWATVTKVGGLGWLAENRGRGDVLVVGPGPETYTILEVVSDDELTLTSPATASHSGVTYTIARQFAKLEDWEDCISSGGSCTYFATGGGDLVGDDRSEVGIAYDDNVFSLSSDVVFEGATTDALHTITLTADGRNRHNGISGAGVVVDGQDNPTGFVVRDDHVTIEWIEIIRVRDANDEASILVESDGQTSLLFQNLLIHDYYDPARTVAGIALSSSGAGNRTVTIRNTMIWDGDDQGIHGGRTSDRVTIENCSIDYIRDTDAAGIDAAESVVTVVNTIVTRSTTTDFDPDLGSFSAASMNNTSWDTSAPGPGFQHSIPASSLFVNPGVDLHLVGSPNPALDSAIDLFATSGFQNDVDGELRPVGSGWDRGADELSSGALDLALTKDDGQTTAVPGTGISYAITVTNNGPDPVTGVIVSDSLPPEVLSPWFTTANGTYNSGTGEWFFAAPLFAGQSTTLSFNGTIDPAATGALTNSATVSPLPGQTDTNSTNDTDSDVDTLTPQVDLEISKSDTADPIDIGNVLLYTLAVTNRGPSEATGVTVVDTLVPDLEYQLATPSQGLCNYDDPSRTLTCNLGNVAPGATATIALVVRPLHLGTFGNTASVGGNEPDPVSGNNSDSALTTVGAAQSCIVTTDLEGGDDWGYGVGVQGDGRIVVGGHGFRPSSGGQDFAVVRYGPDFTLDSSFGTVGKVATEIVQDDLAVAMALLSDGRVLLGGHDGVGAGLPDDNFTLVRYDTDGSPDSTFNPGGTYGDPPNAPGIVTTDVGGTLALGRALALQPDGKMLLAGPVGVPGTYDLGIVRYQPDGALDPSFGTGGKVTTPIGAADDWATSMALQPDGRIVVGGATWNGTDWDWLIVRYDPSGSLDGSFGLGGVVVADHGVDEWTGAVAVQPDGKIVLIGQSTSGVDGDFAVARYNPDGSPDLTFNPTGTFGDPPHQPGMVFVKIGVADDRIGSGVLQPDGRVLAVGWSDNGINVDFAMVRLNPDGALDASFGTGGKVTTAIGGDRDEARAVALQPDGRILLAGRSYNVGTSNWDFALARYTSAGRLEGGCGTTRYRSIGTAADYSAGVAGVTAGSTLVTGTGTLWQGANRGRGDVITIAASHYTVLSVDSETSLTLTEPYAGATASEPYLLRRQFTTLQAWEACISGAGGCVYFPVGSGNLITDNRSEVGIAYDDTVFIMTSELRLDGSTTDALHTITLTVDPGNRHDGNPGAGVVIDAQDSPFGIDVEDDHVTLEWLEITRFRGADNEGAVTLSGGDGPRGVLLQNLLIHDFFDPIFDVSGIRLSGVGMGKSITVRNTMIWNGDEHGIRGDEALDTLVIENTSIDGMTDASGQGIYAEDSTVTVVNTIVTGSAGVDFDPGAGTFLGSHNTSSDATAPGANPQTGVAAADVFVSPGVDLHLKGGPNPALDSALDLFSDSGFQNDVEGQLRPGDTTWDRGADEFSTSTVDLALTKDDGQTAAVPGAPISYTITVTNNGPDPVTRVTVTDPIPPAILGASFLTLNGSYSAGTGQWTFASPLLSGQSTALALNGTIDPAATGSLTNTATVAPPSGYTDASTGNDSDSDLDSLNPQADLEVTKTDDIDPIEVDSLLTYTLTVVNRGPSNASGVTVTDVLPPEVEYQSATPSQGGCGFNAPLRTLTCTLGSIAASGNGSVALVVRPTAVGTASNTADVTGNEPDPVPGNNTSTQLTDLQSSAEGVRFLTVTSTFERNVLEWLNPGGAYLSTEIVYRTDRFPNAPVEPGTTSLYDAGTAGLKDRLVHNTGVGTNTQTYYYAAFVHRSAAPAVSAGRFCTGRPFDTSGAVKWAFSTGAFSITPPTVGAAGIVAPANDRALYAMARGPLGGEWPVDWEPAQLGGVVQSRSPIIPLTVNGANPVVYLGAHDGSVYAVNGTMGGAAAFPWGPSSIAFTTVQAAPAGIFSAWGGAHDYLLVGTRDDGADNRMVALNPDTPGNELGSFDNGGFGNGIGIISGMATVDYVTSRVYFASHENATGSNSTLWCLQMGPPGPVLDVVWQRALQDIDSSPVVYNGRVYVGSKDGGGTVYSINAATGAMGDDRVFVHGNGQVKGFVWPDRHSTDLYFATTNMVWGISDTGAATMVDKFSPSGGVSLGGGGVTPSTVLFVPGSHYLYVGGSDGQLYEIDVLPATPTQRMVPLGDGQALVGAPSLDWFHDLIHVGTEAGIFYAVDVPLP